MQLRRAEGVKAVPDNRNDRLKSDYREMLKIQNRPWLSWVVTKGEHPYAEEYLLTVRLRTYVLSAAEGKYIVSTIPGCTVAVTLRDSYPYVAPYVRMLSIPPVFHPDWYSKGTYCSSEPWRPENSLKDYIMRMLSALRYEPTAPLTAAPANFKAQDWFLKNRDNAALFPSDRTELTENDPAELDALEKAALSRWDC